MAYVTSYFENKGTEAFYVAVARGFPGEKLHPFGHMACLGLAIVLRKE